MKIILNDDVMNLGEEGDICVVKSGYGRNYLIPKGLAVPCTRGNQRIFAQRQVSIDKRKEEKRNAAKSLVEKIEALSLTIKVAAGETGRLFGSVSNATLSDALAKEGIQVERKKIEVVGTHVKMVGDYTAKVKLYAEAVAELKFSIEGEIVSGSAAAPKKAKVEVAKAEVVAEKTEEVVAEAVEVVEAAEVVAEEASTEDQE